MGRVIRTEFAALLLLCALGLMGSAWAAGPVETSVYAVQGVDVDVTDANAAAAKEKALVLVQMKAFVLLAEKLGTPEFATEMGKLEGKDVIPMLKSLSIEVEKISPGHYEGKFTVRFLPEKIKSLYGKYGISVPQSQGQAMLVLPVWTATGGQPVLWEDNPWRKAWLGLNAQQAQIPIIIPLGDQDDSAILTPQDAMNIDAVKLEALRRRYDVKTLLVAYAEPAPGGGVHAHMIGKSPLGKITFDKVYTADSGTENDSAVLATQRFQQIMVEKFKSDQAKVAAAKAASAGPQSIAVAIPFSGPSQWNGLRARILATPGVIAVDVTSLDGQGASARLVYSGAIEDVQSSFQTAGLNLARSGGSWVIQAP
jgi:Uncharacterized protein conserved in bacteria (DUF2066)